MEYWLSHKDGKIVEQILCDEGVEPRWSPDSADAVKVQVAHHGDALAELFDPDTLSWSPCPVHALNLLKAERNRRLLDCDYPPLIERPDDEQPAWKDYRQALRDFPDTVTDPFNPEWPDPPKKKG